MALVGLDLEGASPRAQPQREPLLVIGLNNPLYVTLVVLPSEGFVQENFIHIHISFWAEIVLLTVSRLMNTGVSYAIHY